MDNTKLDSLLAAITREQRLRSDLEVQVSHERQRLQCNKKYIATLVREKEQKAMELREAEIAEKELRFDINPRLERELTSERESRSSMQVTISALHAKKAELEQHLIHLQSGAKRDLAARSEKLQCTAGNPILTDPMVE